MTSKQIILPFFFYFPFRVSDDVLHLFGGHSVLKILLLEGVLPGK